MPFRPSRSPVSDRLRDKGRPNDREVSEGERAWPLGLPNVPEMLNFRSLQYTIQNGAMYGLMYGHEEGHHRCAPHDGLCSFWERLAAE